jgi:hypothetical protein
MLVEESVLNNDSLDYQNIAGFLPKNGFMTL